MCSDAIVRMDDGVLSEERLAILAKIAPREDEVKAVRAFVEGGGEAEQLANVERFFLAMSAVPNVQRRVELMLYRAQFDLAFDVLSRWIAVIEQACKVP